ncbi:hypothetical protein [Pseudoxanthomonas putridarboris]|uniref:Uncharacterized protein n=1 Tax=Pseudoxanthomonas putridarboris TaxID=752605 RepID=A0ABU9IZM2_9GAMM
MNLQQWKELQPRIVDVQRLALVFAELGESKVSYLLMQAGIRASRIKPAAEQGTEQPAPKKGKGA